MFEPGAPVQMGDTYGVIEALCKVEERGDEPAVRWWWIRWADGTRTACTEGPHLIDVEAREWADAPMVPDEQACYAQGCWLRRGHRTRWHRNPDRRWV